MAFSPFLCYGHAGRKEKRKRQQWSLLGSRRGPEWHLASKMANTRAGDETVPLLSRTNTFCQVIPPSPPLSHTGHAQNANSQEEWGRGLWGRSLKEMERSKEVCILNTHAEKGITCTHTHRENRHCENCPSLSLIPSVCLRQLVITKATCCCRGNPWGTTQRGWRGFGEDELKRKRVINEEERKHRYDQCLSASPPRSDRRGKWWWASWREGSQLMMKTKNRLYIRKEYMMRWCVWMARHRFFRKVMGVCKQRFL